MTDSEITFILLELASLVFGKRIGHVLYVHSSAISSLVPENISAIFECEYGVVLEDILIKRKAEASMHFTLLHYPNFMSDAHPRLCCSVSFASDGTIQRRVWRGENRPILHRKELFLPPDHPRRELFKRLTEQEERSGLLDNPSKIGWSKNWDARLSDAGIIIDEHEIKLVGYDD